MTTYVKLADGSSIQLQDTNMRPDDVIKRIQKFAHTGWVAFHDTDGYILRVNPAQIVSISERELRAVKAGIE